MSSTTDNDSIKVSSLSLFSEHSPARPSQWWCPLCFCLHASIAFSLTEGHTWVVSSGQQGANTDKPQTPIHNHWQCPVMNKTACLRLKDQDWDSNLVAVVTPYPLYISERPFICSFSYNWKASSCRVQYIVKPNGWKLLKKRIFENQVIRFYFSFFFYYVSCEFLNLAEWTWPQFQSLLWHHHHHLSLTMTPVLIYLNYLRVFSFFVFGSCS